MQEQSGNGNNEDVTRVAFSGVMINVSGNMFEAIMIFKDNLFIY